MMSAEKTGPGLSRSSVWPSHDPSRCLSHGWPCSRLSDDTGPAGGPALLRGAGLGAVGKTAGAVAEGGAEGHGAQ